jgi:hypothetical protein
LAEVQGSEHFWGDLVGGEDAVVVSPAEEAQVWMGEAGLRVE